MLTTELLLGLISVVTTVGGGLLYVAKRRADAKLEQVRNEGARFDQLMQLINRQAQNLEQQIQVNKTFTEALQQKEHADEQNYRTLRAVVDRHAAEIITATRTGRDRVIEAVNHLPEKVATINQAIATGMADTLTEIVRKAVELRDDQRTLIDKVAALEQQRRSDLDKIVALEMALVRMGNGAHDEDDQAKRNHVDSGRPDRVIAARADDVTVSDPNRGES